MFNYTCEIPEVGSPKTDNSSIWNSAGLTSTDFNPNLPEISTLFQNAPDSFAPSSASISSSELETVLPQFSSYMQLNSEPSSKLSDQDSNSSPFLSNAPSSISPTSSDGLTIPSTSQPSSLSPIHPLSSAAAIPKDPGYYSESECSSNSSEKEIISATFTKTLQLESEAATDPIPQSSTNNNLVISKPLSTIIPIIDDNVFKNLQPRFDSQSFDAQDFNFCGDETWKAIKKPGKEPSMISSPDISQNVASDCSWSGNSSPALSAHGSTGSVSGGKPTFSQYTKQQVCVFCRNNGEDESVYSTHTLMSTAGKVVCPILYAYKCPICHATGDYAHTLKYCPMMPKGLNTGTNPNANARANPVVSVLPKTATFPQHLSINARQNMSRNTQGIKKKPPKFQTQHQQMGMPNAQPDALGSIVELQEAAQKILMFTNQVMGTQQHNVHPQNIPCPPQIAQFLLKLDTKQNAEITPFNNSGNDINAKNFPASFPNAFPGIPSRSNFPSAQEMSDILAASGQGYQPFQSMPQPTPENVGLNSDINIKIKEFMNSQGLDFNIPPESTNSSDWFLGSQPTKTNIQPTMSQSFNISAPPFIPLVGNEFNNHNTNNPLRNLPDVSNPSMKMPDMCIPTIDNSSNSNTASEELYKILGINKTEGSALNAGKSAQISKESALASILANLKELEQAKNCG